MFGTKKPQKSKPQEGSMEDLMAALQEADANHQKRVKQDRKRKRGPGWLSGVPGYARAAIAAALVILVVLIADGIRREAGEMGASFDQVSGQVTVLKGGTAATPASPRMELATRDVVRTGPDGSATVVFPDGSAIQIEPNTEFEIRLMDFARGGVRDRSFMVRSGRVVSRVGKFFGAGSQSSVQTPTAVAAARGTGYSVYYDPVKKETYVGVVDGTVRFRTSAGEAQSTIGQLVSSSGYQVKPPLVLNASQQTRIRTGFDAMGRHDRAPGFLQNVEYAVNAFLDPALQLIGLAPGSWSYGASYAARRAACMEALKRLSQHMVSLQDEQIPETISLTTMEELGWDPRQRDRALETFAGGMLESYRKTGVGKYEIRVRARDKKRTLYELTDIGIQEIKE